MSNVVWYWRKGNINIFTRQIDMAQKALKDGKFVKTLKDKPHIFVHAHL